MRTTLNLDDDLARAVKAKAAAEGRTLTSVVEDALRRALDEKPAEYAHVSLPTFSSELAPGVDLSDPQALRDLMYEDEDAHFRSMIRDQDA